MDNHSKTAIAKKTDDAPIARDGLAPLAAAMMERGGVDTAGLEKLMELQERFEAKEAKKAYARALVEMKKDLPQIIGHDQVVDYTGNKGRVFYTHASLAAVAEAVVPVLCNYGFAHQFLPETRNGKVALTCRILHCEGHFDERTLDAAPDTSGGKNSVQGIASTTTYLSRYLLCSMLGITTKEMREADDVHDKPSPERQAAIDPKRTANALRWLKSQGVDQADAEGFIGSEFQKWTVADLQKLKPWVAELEAQSNDDEPVDAEFEEADEWGPNTGPDEDDR